MIADRQKYLVLKKWFKTPPVPKIIFCDTDAITTEIYSRHYLGEVPKEVYDAQNELQYDHYFYLTYQGTPWVKDPLRDLGDQREEMDIKFREALNTRGIYPWYLNGTWEERFAVAEQKINDLIRGN